MRFNADCFQSLDGLDYCGFAPIFSDMDLGVALALKVVCLHCSTQHWRLGACP